MSTKVVTKVRFHYPAFNQFRKQPTIAEDLLRRGRAIADQAGQGLPSGSFQVIVSKNASRARVIVVAANIYARVAEAKERALTRALDAGRG